jgi:hypothetical protein
MILTPMGAGLSAWVVGGLGRRLGRGCRHRQEGPLNRGPNRGWTSNEHFWDNQGVGGEVLSTAGASQGPGSGARSRPSSLVRVFSPYTYRAHPCVRGRTPLSGSPERIVAVRADGRPLCGCESLRQHAAAEGVTRWVWTLSRPRGDQHGDARPSSPDLSARSGRFDPPFARAWSAPRGETLEHDPH